ncbi:MAG: XRE family transcriptional regulator [Chloroflexota bacterium]|nr:XRE family transcriptional regulator [Chloroflexota bacterium]
MDSGSDSLDLNALGARVRAERSRRGLSLDALAARAAVSRSMLVAVETGAKAATVSTLHKIATGLGTNMTRLLDEERGERVVVLSRGEHVVVRDPTGWERRNLAPAIPGVDFELMRTTIPPGVDAGVYPPHAAGSREYVAVERGSLRLTIGAAVYALEAGDSAAYAGDRPHGFANAGDDTCVYYLAVENGVGNDAPKHGRKLDRENEKSE